MKAAEYNALIPLTEMAEFLGYVRNTRKGTAKARWMVYDKFTDGKKDHTIVINRALNTYFCKQTNEHGSLVQFVKNRVRDFPSWKPYAGNALDTLWEETKGVLDDYLGPGARNGVAPTLPDNPLRTFRLSDYDVYFPSPSKAKVQHFLVERRCISVDTIAFFLQHRAIAHVRDKTLEFAYSNYAFPMTIPGHAEIVNFELRNHNSRKGLSFKGFCPGGNKSEALWTVPFTEAKEVKDVYVFESAIDAMSFYDLMHPSPASAVVSCGGYLTYGSISRLPELFPSAQFHSCCDNDLAGNLYDVMLAYYLKGIRVQAFRLDTRQEDGTWSKSVRITLPKEEPIQLPAETFSSRSFLSMQGMNNILLRHCAPQFKDWNEHLCARISNSASQKEPFIQPVT